MHNYRIKELVEQIKLLRDEIAAAETSIAAQGDVIERLESQIEVLMAETDELRGRIYEQNPDYD